MEDLHPPIPPGVLVTSAAELYSVHPIPMFRKPATHPPDVPEYSHRLIIHRIPLTRTYLLNNVLGINSQLCNQNER